ncbi:hypothetical protein OH77DRAFT_1427749 [Trametes cingulata]|nr:hypothetical protein OH77DRAFT_1427749 [Trametes cingulata]
MDLLQMMSCLHTEHAAVDMRLKPWAAPPFCVQRGAGFKPHAIPSPSTNVPVARAPTRWTVPTVAFNLIAERTKNNSFRTRRSTHNPKPAGSPVAKLKVARKQRKRPEAGRAGCMVDRCVTRSVGSWVDRYSYTSHRTYDPSTSYADRVYVIGRPGAGSPAVRSFLGVLAVKSLDNSLENGSRRTSYRGMSVGGRSGPYGRTNCPR